MAYKYEAVPGDQGGAFVELDFKAPKRPWYSRNRRFLFAMLGFSVVLLVLVGFALGRHQPLRRATSGCEAGLNGYQCSPEISHYWGQYSPFYSVPSDISSDVPSGCQITFAQVLSRHGSRDPTMSKTIQYGALVTKIKQSVPVFPGNYSFLANYTYSLGADQLTFFGQREMVDSGAKYYQRYGSLAKSTTVFVRASGENRVVESANNFTQGYHQAHIADNTSTTRHDLTSPIVAISEKQGSNNTLNHGLCDSFEDGPESLTGKDAQKQWQSIFAKPITARWNSDLPGANLTSSDTIFLMDLCPLNTVASSTGRISEFCNLFSENEWQQYDYYQSLGKYYGNGNGNALGPTQGVGFTNELIARLTNKPVQDHTSVNQTLDASNATFPIGNGQVLYADFSHDNDMTGIFGALGLYNRTTPLSNTSIESTTQTKGYSASWTVPFAARAYFEKMSCEGSSEELVRVLVNDRVLPLESCGGDSLGRCTLTDFVSSLSFAQGGGGWDQCFPDEM